MAILEINGDFSAEKKVSDGRFDSINAAIKEVDDQVLVLKNSWNDEKSATIIESIEDYTTTIKDKLITAQKNANEIFDKLYKCLKIWKTE